MRQAWEPPPPGAGNAGGTAPLINAPPVVVGLSLSLLILHMIRIMADPEVQDLWGGYLAFTPLRYLPDMDAPGAPWASYSTFLTYAFLHADWSHAGLNAIWLLAFGTPVCRRVGGARFFFLFAAAVAAGALLFWALHSQDDVMLIGASGGVSGLMGAAARFVFRPTYHPDAGPVPLLSLGDRRIVFFVAIWAGMNFLFSLGLGLAGDGVAAISWEAHAGGFAAGLLLMPLLDRKLTVQGRSAVL